MKNLDAGLHYKKKTEIASIPKYVLYSKEELPTIILLSRKFKKRIWNLSYVRAPVFSFKKEYRK